MDSIYMLGRVTGVNKLGTNGSQPIRIYPLEDDALLAHEVAMLDAGKTVVCLKRSDMAEKHINELTIWTRPADFKDKKGSLRPGDLMYGHFDITNPVKAKATDPADPKGVALVDKVLMKDGEPVMDPTTNDFIVLLNATLKPAKEKDVKIKRDTAFEEAVTMTASVPGLEG